MAIDFGRVEFDSSNPEPRCPCVLLLDTSGSMSGEPVEELNRGLQEFQKALVQDNLAMMRVELAIVTFGPVTVEQDFVTANQFIAPQLVADGFTPMGEAINCGLDMIEARKQTYRENGVAYYRPWVFLITDGGSDDWHSAAQRVHASFESKKLSFFAVGVEGADMDALRQISPPGRAPLKLKGLSFRDMFQWLSSSLARVSQSRPGDAVPLQSPMGWGEA